MNRRRAAAVVIVAAAGQESRTRAVLVGLEEEGVPAQVLSSRECAAVEPDDADGLAEFAARRADFDVGIGVAADGRTHVRHARLPADHLGGVGPHAAEHELRGLGQDAGRLVTRLPLRHLGARPARSAVASASCTDDDDGASATLSEERPKEIP